MEHSTLRDVLRKRREELGLSQEELAERMGYRQEWVSNVETGRTATPRMRTLHRLSEAIGVPLAELVIAAGYARTRTEAEAVIAEDAAPPDPTTAVILDRTKDWAPEKRRALAAFIEAMSDDDGG